MSILFICYESEKEYLVSVFDNHQTYTLIIDTVEQIKAMGMRAYVAQRIEIIRNGTLVVKGITASNDFGILIASYIARQTGNIAPSYESLRYCTNKYHSRRAQQEVIPNHTPFFFLYDDHQVFSPALFPLFVKPVRSSLSFGAHRVNSQRELEYITGVVTPRLKKANQWYYDCLQLLKINNNTNATYKLLVEEYVTGSQITLDGYVYENEVTFLGLTQAHMMPGTLSFVRFDYPAYFKKNLELQIYKITQLLIQRFAINNTFFNIEFMVDEEQNKVWVIEMHGRVSLQFTPLIENVIGYNPLVAVCDISVGKRPDSSKGYPANRFTRSSSCILRKVTDHKILRVPTKNELQIIKKKYKNIRIFPLVEKNACLSDYRQDSHTFRYIIIDIPGQNMQEIVQTLEKIKKDLHYIFEPVLKELL